MKKIDFTDIGHQIQALQKTALIQTLKICNPRVEKIIDSESENEEDIKSVLDMLNEVGFDKDAASLYNELCLYYSKLNVRASEEYVQLFIESWGVK